MCSTTRRLLAKVIVFSTSLIPLYFVGHHLIYELHHWVRTTNDSEAVYVIGDSRTHHSVDLTLLRKATGRSFYSHTQPAMSAYSVLKMAEMVPPGATVLFGPSWGMMLRDRRNASFRSGFSLRGLRLMLEGEGVYWHLRRVLVVNRIPVEAPFFRFTPPLPDSKIRDMKKLRLVQSFYLNADPTNLETKKQMLKEAIRVLLAKGCKLEVIQVPIPDDIAEVRDRTYGSVIEALDLGHHPNVRIHDDIRLEHPRGENIWMDADHMNARGRALLTAYLIEDVFGARRRSSDRSPHETLPGLAARTPPRRSDRR